jgi:flagellar biosynthesis protein FliR
MLLFLLLDGQHAMLLGIRGSFDYLPPLTAAGEARLLELMAGMAMATTTLAVRVAAPVCVAMLVVDLGLGMIGRTIPQMNLMSIGLSLRWLVGLVIMILGLAVAASVLSNAIHDGLTLAEGLVKPALP